MTRKARITVSLAALTVAAAAGSAAWGLVAQSTEPSTPSTPSPAGACYIENPDCDDTPGFLDS
jgi:hypothetical protein